MMNREGRIFLASACDTARKWAAKYDTLAQAWEACKRADWLRWALDKVGAGSYAYRSWSSWQIKKHVSNPFQKHLYCFFCDDGSLLSEEEARYSEIVGSLPRCREHLRAVGLDLAA